MRTREGCRERCMVPVLRGRKFIWPRSNLEMTSGLLDSYRPSYSFKPGAGYFDGCFPFSSRADSLVHLSSFLQISNSTESDCVPKLFVISSKVRVCVLPFFSQRCACRRWRVRSCWKYSLTLMKSSSLMKVWGCTLGTRVHCAAAAHIYVTRKGHKHMWHAELHEAHVWPSSYKHNLTVFRGKIFLDVHTHTASHVPVHWINSVHNFTLSPSAAQMVNTDKNHTLTHLPPLLLLNSVSC